MLHLPSQEEGLHVSSGSCRKGTDMTDGWDIFKIYRLIRKKNQYPHLLGLMNLTFMEILEQRGIISRDALHQKALGQLKSDGLPETEDNRQEYVEVLTDAYFANSFPPGEVENYINLARKRDRAQTLSMVVNRDQATAMEVFKALREFCEIPKGEVYISPEEAVGIRVALISRFISNQLPFISLAKNYITIRDMDLILPRCLWSRRRPGRMGGKAAGMLLAYKILLPFLEKHDPELEEYIRVPDTWYLNSGVFSEFLDRNNLYLFHTFKYKNREEIEREFTHVEEKFRYATFAPEVLEDFRKILEEIGEHPIIIRSSSLLEDNFGLAFSGKYLSVFLTNQGDLESRLSNFIGGLKRVFASTFGPDPILYRMDHGLLDFDERMAMVVQKVVGRRFGDYFFPFVSGVLFSRNVYAWNPKIRKEEGLGRLVLGLGTRAVDRVGSDYPRMVPLSHPLLRPEVTAGPMERRRRPVNVRMDMGPPRSSPPSPAGRCGCAAGGCCAAGCGTGCDCAAGASAFFGGGCLAGACARRASGSARLASRAKRAIRKVKSSLSKIISEMQRPRRRDPTDGRPQCAASPRPRRKTLLPRPCPG